MATSHEREEEKEQEKWDAYPNTVLEFTEPPTLRVDLREPLDDDARSAIAARGLEGPFAVLTAENPGGEHVEDSPTPSQEEARAERNEARTSRLERALRERGIRFVLVDGMAPTGDYREHCVAVAMPRRDAAELARGLDQLALFWYDGRDFWLLPAEVDAEPERLPRAKGAS